MERVEVTEGEMCPGQHRRIDLLQAACKTIMVRGPRTQVLKLRAFVLGAEERA